MSCRSILVLCAVVALLVSTTTASLHVADDFEQTVVDFGKKKITCAKCEEYAGILVGVVNNSLLFPEVIKLAEASCEKKFPNSTKDVKLCKDVIKAAGKYLPKILGALEKLAWDIPLTVCADIVKACTAPCCSDETTPEQFHLTFADQQVFSANNTRVNMRLTWVTRNNTPGVGIRVWPSDGSNDGFTVAETGTRTYTSGGWRGVIHWVDFTVGAGTNYTYTVGMSPNNYPYQKFSFVSLPANIGSKARPLRVVTIADMGYGPRSTNTINQIAQLVEDGQVDMVVHSGDISYADADEGHWDVFWNKVQPIAARVPYMTTPGNHEMYWNFSAYKARTGDSMPSAGPNAPEGAMYYALNIGPVNMIMLDSETWVDTADINKVQQKWLAHQLALANSDRMATPWLLQFQHRPLYCSQHTKLQCDIFTALLRGQVEKQFMDAKVDIAYAGHLHSWERTYPTYDSKALSTNYTQPPAPVYLVNGAAGNREGNSLPPGGESWHAFGTKATGYSTYTVTADTLNNDHSLDVFFYQASDNSVVDSFTINKSIK